MEFLYAYGLFLAKTLTLLGGFALILILIGMLRQRQPEGTLKAEILNEVLEDYKDLLSEVTLSEAEIKAINKAEKKKRKEQKNVPDSLPACYVLDFKGDLEASGLDSLKECISAIVQIASNEDCVLLKLESGGGYVPHYGAAASQLMRLRDKNIPLTVSVDKIAGSGGYMMACVGNDIIASHFAVLGSIGVIGEVPNFHRFLDKHDIDYEQHTSTHFKRTLTTFGKNTDSAREKFKEGLGDIHVLFKDHVKRCRPSVDIEKIATGETWYGPNAVAAGLVDKLQTAEDFILDRLNTHQIVALTFEEPKTLREKLMGASRGLVEGLYHHISSLPSSAKGAKACV